MGLYEPLRSHLEHWHNDQTRLELDLARLRQDRQHVASIMMMPPAYLKSTEQLRQELGALIRNNVTAEYGNLREAPTRVNNDAWTRELNGILRALSTAGQREAPGKLGRLRNSLRDERLSQKDGSQTLPCTGPSVTGTIEIEDCNCRACVLEPVPSGVAAASSTLPWDSNKYLKPEDRAWLKYEWNRGNEED